MFFFFLFMFNYLSTDCGTENTYENAIKLSGHNYGYMFLLQSSIIYMVSLVHADARAPAEAQMRQLILSRVTQVFCWDTSV